MFERLFARIMPANLMAGAIAARHLPLVVFAYVCLLPRELMFEIFDAALLPYRLALFALVPFVIASIARTPLRPSWLDLTVVFAVIWVPVSLYFTTSLDAAIISGGSFVVDLGMAYLVGRSAIRTPQDFRTVCLLILPGLLALVGIMAMESVSHRLLLRPTLANLVGIPMPNYFYDVRFGLLRAMGPFPHPILGGVFLASLLPLAWYLSHNGWQRLVACAVACGAIFTVSSAALIGLFMAALLIVFDIIQRLSKLPIFLFAGFYTAIVVVAIAIMSENGLINFLVRRLTLDPESGYYRMLIWEYGGAEAMSHPWFGIGQSDWSRPVAMANDSIDAYWLLLAMFYGFPAMGAVLLVTIGAIFALLRTQKYRHPADRDCAKGVVFFIIIVVFAGLTVHLWENVHGWIFGVVGGAVSLATQARTVPVPLRIKANPGPFDWIISPFRGVRA